MAGPLARFGEHAPRDPSARLRGDSTVGCARRAEAQPFGDDAVDDAFLLRERDHVDIGDELVRLEQVLERLMRAGDREAADRDVAPLEIEVQILDLDLGAQQLRADLLRLAPRDRVGEEPPQ